MSIRRAHLLHPLLRLTVLALLALSVLVAPVACALGDVHALAHGQAHVDEDASHHADGEDERDGTGLMHALMHSGYCHGQSPALLPALAWQGVPLPAQLRPAAGHQDYRSHLLDTLLRPPIAA